MTVYYGIVHDNHVELDGEVQLAEGTRVEIRPVPTSKTETELVNARLRALGLLITEPVFDELEDEDEDFVPAVAQGEPISEQIIRERR